MTDPTSSPASPPPSGVSGVSGPGDGDHEPTRTDLAGYVLGGLTVDEQLAVEAHLATCADCRGELAELDPLPVLLDLAGAVPAIDAPTVSSPAIGPAPVPTDLPGSPAATRLTTSSASDRSPTAPTRPDTPRRRQVLVGAVAVMAVAAALGVGVLIGRPAEPSFSAPLALQAVDGPADVVSASGTAALRVTDAGTVVRLDLSDLPNGDGTYFECLWSSSQGAQSAGTFRAGADGSVEVDLLTAARPYPGWSLEIVEHRGGLAEGQPVLRADA